MLVAIVALFGLVVVVQLRGISRQLEGSRLVAQELKELVTTELRWYKDSTFARDLKEWIEEAQKEVTEELQWHKNLTFAHALKEWIERVEDAAEEILKTLNNIESNTAP